MTGRPRYASRRARAFRRRNRRLLTGLLGIVVAGALAGVWAAVSSGRATIQVTVGGRAVGVGAGTSVGDAARRFGLEPQAGNLLDVEGRILRSKVFPGHLLVNGRPTSAEAGLRPGDRLGVRNGTSRRERLTREITPASLDHPGNPQYFVSRVPGSSIIARGAVSHKLASVRFVPDGPPTADDAVALTFDDGPSPYTSRILALLAQFHVPATFFVVGTQAEAYPKLVAQELSAGMAVGDHSYDHPWRQPFAALPHRDIRREVDGGQAVLRRLGVRSVLFRPPGGSLSPQVLRAASRNGMRVVLWSVDARDWVEGATATEIARRVLQTVRAGSIVVLHDGGGNREATVRALPAIIAGIRERGLRFVALAPTG